MLHLRTGGGLRDDLLELFHLTDEETEAQGHIASKQQGPDTNRRMKAHSVRGTEAGQEPDPALSRSVHMRKQRPL